MPDHSLTDGTTIQPTTTAETASSHSDGSPAIATTGRVAVPVSASATAPLAGVVSSHPRLDAMIASAPSVSDATAGIHPHPDSADFRHASNESPLIFPLPPLDSSPWSHPLFPLPSEHSGADGGPQGVAPPGQAALIQAPPANRTVDVLAALVIDLAVLGLLGYLVARGHLRTDFAGIMALVGLILHHRRAVPILPRLFPR